MIRVIGGMLFLLSGVFKLMCIDNYELHVYSYEFMSLNFALVAARLMISAELLIGLLLIFGLYVNLIWKLTLALLGVFLLFPLLQWIKGSDDFYYCIADFKVTPVIAVIKNLALMIVLPFSSTGKSWVPVKWQRATTALLFVTGLLVPFIVSPPDSWLMEKNLAKDEMFNYPATAMTKMGTDSLAKMTNEIYAGKKAVCFMSATCEYCRKSSRKMSIMAKKFGFYDNVTYVFPIQSMPVRRKFFKETHTPEFRHTHIPMRDLLKITGGEIPRIYLLDNGVIKGKYGYRDLPEKEVAEFFRHD